MVDYKKFEEDCYLFLKDTFEDVEWLSERNIVPIDFKCRNGDIIYLIDAKYTKEGAKPIIKNAQRNVDAIITNDGEGIRIVWKKDFPKEVSFSTMTLIKISTDNKQFLDEKKITPRESYDEVLSRLLRL